MSLKTMTVSKLKALKHQVEAAIHAKVTERRHEIESEPSKLSRFDDGRGAKVVRAGREGWSLSNTAIPVHLLYRLHSGLNR